MLNKFCAGANAAGAGLALYYDSGSIKTATATQHCTLELLMQPTL
jgi:hypothetical protein